MTYWPDHDTLHIDLTGRADSADSEVVRDDFVMDFDHNGRLVSVEVLNARVNVPQDLIDRAETERETAHA